MRFSIVRLLRKGAVEINRENSVMIKNLSWLSGPSHVKEYFSKYGDVKNVYLPFDEKQGIYRGYGFVQFATQISAKEAIEDQSRVKLDGNNLNVSKPFENKITKS